VPTAISARTPAWAETARRRARLDGTLTVFVAIDGAPAGVLVLADPASPGTDHAHRNARRP
jgi:hypothetical protein